MRANGAGVEVHADRRRPAAFGMSIGTVIGSTRRGPRSRRVSQASSRVQTPPMPVAQSTPRRSGSTSGEPASAQASRAGDERELARRVEALDLDALEHLVRAHLRLGGEGDGQLVARRPTPARGCARRTRRRAGRSSSRGRCRRGARCAPMPVTTIFLVITTSLRGRTRRAPGERPARASDPGRRPSGARVQV